MRYLLCLRDAPIARVDLDVGEPSGGVLEPLPDYATVAPTFQAVGNAQWQAHVPRALVRPPPLTPATRHAAAQALAALRLTTEAGTPVAAERLDLWDAPLTGDPPFLLVWWGAAGAPVPARVPPRPRQATDARPGA